MNRERIYKWDNAKAVMMFLVVLGHFITSTRRDSPLTNAIYLFIHIFHMPVFMFVSGLFSQNTLKNREKIWIKFIGFMFLCFALKYVTELVHMFSPDFSHISLRGSWGAAWYLFVLAIYLMITPLFDKVDRRLLLGLAVISAMFAGYDENIGRTWCMSRLIVFYPYFLLGTMWDPKRISAGKYELFSKVCACLVLGVLALVVWNKLDTFQKIRDLFFGYSPYEDFLSNVKIGMFYRLGAYILAILSGAAVIVLCPNRKLPITNVGVRSLQIYLIHYPIRELYEQFGWKTIMMDIWPAHWKILVYAFPIVLTLFLSLPIFEIPLKWFWKAINSEQRKS